MHQQCLNRKTSAAEIIAGTLLDFISLNLTSPALSPHSVGSGMLSLNFVRQEIQRYWETECKAVTEGLV